MRFLAGILCSLVCCSPCLAQEFFQSKEAKKAAIDYEKHLREAKADYVKGLENALDEAAAAKDADEIVRIKMVLRRLEADEENPFLMSTLTLLKRGRIWTGEDRKSENFHQFAGSGISGTLLTKHITGGMHQTGKWARLADGSVYAFWDRNTKGVMPKNEMLITAGKDGGSVTVIGYDNKTKVSWGATWVPKD